MMTGYRFLRDLVLVFGGTAALLLVFMYLRRADTQNDVARPILESLLDQSEDRVIRLFDDANRVLLMIDDWAAGGLLQVQAPDRLTSLLLPVLRQNPSLSGTLVLSPQAGRYRLVRTQDGWWATISDATGRGREATLSARDSLGSPGRRWSPWQDSRPERDVQLLEAGSRMNSGTIEWNVEDTLDTRRGSGLLCLIRSSAEPSLVIACELSRGDILEILAGMQLPRGASVFLAGKKEVLLVGAGMDSLQAGLESLVSEYRTSGKNPGAISFRVGRHVWWTAFRQSLGGERPLWTGVVLPESELPIGAKGILSPDFLGSAGIITAGLVLTVLVFRRHYRRLATRRHVLASRDTVERDFTALILGGEGESVEFKSTIRMNLAAGRPGKEMEIAWLKTVVAYLNTNGGAILFGVDDGGEIAGIDPDRFENEDRCRLHIENLVRQHIGAEFSKDILFRIATVRGKTVALLECAPSPDPVFLKVKEDEEFYIRTGPSSTKLPASKILRYVESRQKKGVGA